MPVMAFAQDGDCPAPDDAVARASALWGDADSGREAVEVLKAARACAPQDADVATALGIAYARMGNHPWALRSLQASPDDCRARAWTAWVYLQMAMPDEAARALEGVRCDDEKLAARLEIVRAMIAVTAGRDDDARAALRGVLDADAMSESDADAFENLGNMLGVGDDPNLTWKLELAAGYASNALSGSPNDPALMQKELASGYLDGDLRVSVDPWKRAFARSVVEAQVTGQYLFSDDARDASYLDVALRPGVVLDVENLRFGAYYRPEFLFMLGGDRYEAGPTHFYTAHRVELDFEVFRWLYVFGGVGHRVFRQAVRTRDEFDFGAGARHALGAGFALTWGLTYRQWLSHGDMYNLQGINLSLALDYRIPVARMSLRLSGSFSYDNYPDSAGYFTTDDARTDKALRGNLQIWSPQWHGLSAGILGKASRRWSSAPDYEFEDYRIQFALRWSGGVAFYGPTTVPDDAFALPWELQSESATESIRDIIRQDEDMQRSSSCLQN